MLLSITLGLISLILLLFLAWCTRTYSYWQRHGIPYVKPIPLIGTLKDVLTLKKNISVHLRDIYNDEAFKNEPVVGIYMLHQPALLIRDPELIKSIFVRKFQNFRDRYAYIDPKVDPFGGLNLFTAKYDTWSNIRPKFSPLFSSVKLKQMFPLMVEVGNNLESYLHSKGDRFTADVKNICSMYTTDQITSIAFGIQTQSFENPINEFVSQNNDNIKERSTYKVIIMLLMPRLSSLFRSEMFTQKYQTFLRSCMNRVIEERILSGLTRNDLIDTLIKLRQEAADDGVDKNQQKHYDDVLLAQASAFYLGGYETTLNTIAFALDLLAKHPEIQKRLRAEIKNVLEQFEGNITYMSLSSMQYLDMVIKECLRLYPIVAFLEREHNGKDFSLGRFSLMPHHDFSLPDRMPIFVSALGMHRDPKYWPNPEIFDPERFSPEKSIPPFAYMPFGIGSHNCIGSRLGSLQSKLGVLYFLKSYEIRPQKVNELTFSRNTITLTPDGEILLEFEKDILWQND